MNLICRRIREETHDGIPAGISGEIPLETPKEMRKFSEKILRINFWKKVHERKSWSKSYWEIPNKPSGRNFWKISHKDLLKTNT